MNKKTNVEADPPAAPSALKAIYERAPLPLRWVALPLVFCRRLLRRLRVDLWKVEGIERHTQTQLSILCGVRSQNKNFLLRLAFAGSYREEFINRVWMWNLPTAIRDLGQNCSLVLIEVKQLHPTWLPADSWFLLPCWVKGEVDLPVLAAGMKETVKSDLRTIRKNNLAYDVTQDLHLLDDFYHNMYVPYITNAHGSEAFIISLKEMKARFKHCDLLLVRKTGEYIAGILLLYETAGPRIWSLGIRNGSNEHVKAGAISALFHFSFDYLAIKGFTRVMMGASRSFLRDGVLQYKKKLSQRIVEGSSERFALKVISYTPGTKAFLQNNPFIFETANGLQGAVFLEAQQPPSNTQIEHIDKAHFHPGMSKLVVHFMQGADVPIVVDTLSHELSERIVLRSLGDATLN